MKVTILVLVGFAVFCLVEAAGSPVFEESKVEEFDGLPALNRQTRATCDLLSAEGLGIKINDSACAAHCLLKWKQGYRGGRCQDGICVCRK